MLLFLSIAIALILVGISTFLWFLPLGIHLLWQLPVSFGISYLVSFLFLVIVLVILSLFVSTKNKGKPNYLVSYLMIEIAHFLVTIMGLKVIIEGKEHIPEDSRYMVVANHQSNMDPILLVSILKNPHIAMIMKNNILKVPFLRRYLLAAGYLPLDRDNDRKAIEAVIKGIKWVEAGYTFGAFPEGTRSKKGVMLPYRNGIFKVAQKARCPILTVTMDGLYKIKKNFPLVPTKIYVKIHEVKDIYQFEELTTVELGEQIRNEQLETIKAAREKYSFLKSRYGLEGTKE